MHHQTRTAYVLALTSVLGWSMASGTLVILAYIFERPLHYNLLHFCYVPLLLVLINLAVVHWNLLNLLNLRPIHQTIMMTGMHGLWAEYVGLQVDEVYNGFLVLFLFSFGLLVMKATSGFMLTLLFSIANVAFALIFIYIGRISIGYDEKLFLFFFAFHGISSAYMNSFGRRTYVKMKQQEKEIKTLNSLLASDIVHEKSRSQHAYDQMKKVFYPHQIDQIQAGLALEQTMPIGLDHACVISLDIIASSRFRHESKKEIIRLFLARCGELMQVRYEKNPKIADGFRVKEMGDGFLCSVGYPFATPNQASKSSTSLQLAYGFLQALDDLLQKMDLENRIYCSIGIAYGPIESFFTLVSPIQFDLFGLGIIQATRYEQLRKQLYPGEELNCHHITLQDEVYQSLEQRIRNDFEVVELKQLNIAVRDDAGAERVFVRRIESTPNASLIPAA